MCGFTLEGMRIQKDEQNNNVGGSVSVLIFIPAEVGERLRVHGFLCSCLFSRPRTHRRSLFQKQLRI